MKIHKSILVVSLIVAGTLGLPAQTPPASPAAPSAPSWSFAVTPAFVSQYMFRGVRLGGPSFEPTIEADCGNLALGVWSNSPMADKVVGQSDPEIDPYGSYKFVASDALSIQPGFTWYTYVNANQNNGFYKATFEPNLAVNYTVSGLTLTPKIYYDVVLKGATYEFNAAYAAPLKDLGTELDITGTLGTYKWTAAAENTSPDVKNWGDYWLLSVAAPFQVTKDQKLTLGWAYTEGRTNYFKQATAPRSVNSAAVGRGVVTVSYAWTF
jgi:uncharacterized protein (TIGR02001 family)